MTEIELSAGTIDYELERRNQATDVGGIAFVEIVFEDGSAEVHCATYPK